MAFLRDQKVEGLPRVLSDLEAVQIDGTDFYLYEEQWVEAASVEEIVSRGEGGVECGIRLLTEGARVLAALHERGVVHRDVSSGNVLLGEAGTSVVDLGLAKYLELDPITRSTEQMKMTFLFASPEQLTGGSSALSTATDVYSLALVTIFAAYGGHAFLEEGREIALAEYVARMAHRDYVVDVTSLPKIVRSMLNPIAAFRPTAARIVGDLS